MADQAAVAINKTTDDYINFNARFTPETDPMAVLKDVGSVASHAYTLSGAANTEGTAIKATLLSGWNKLPDCTYTSFGASTLYNAKKDLVLTTVVLLAG